MREQTQYTTMLPNYKIPTDMQAPFFTRSVQPGAWSAHSRTTAHRPYHTTEAAPLFSSESRESGRGRWRRRRNRLPACGNTRLVPLPAQPLVRSALRQGRGRELFPTPGYPLPAHNARAILPTALATARRLPTALATARRLPTALATARRLPTALTTAPRDRLRVRARAAPCGRTCHSPSQ